MIEGYLPAAFEAEWKTVIKPKLFATSKQMGDLQTITFWRDTDTDTTVAIGPFEVLVVMSRWAPSQTQGPAAGFDGRDGEFRKESPFPVAKGDRFTLAGGASGRVETAPITGIAFISAHFTLER